MDKNIPHRLLFKVVLLISQVSEFARYVTYSSLLFGSNTSSNVHTLQLHISLVLQTCFNQFLVQEFFSWNFCPILLTCDSYNLVVRVPSFCPRVQHDNFFKFVNFSFHASKFWFRNSRSNRNNCPTSISCHVTVHYKRVAGRSGCNPVLSIRQ